MKNFKKVILMCLAMVLVAALAIAGTIAYLTDTDSKTNVMTVGSVDIEQIEQEYNEVGELVDFTQAKPLMPYVGELGWENTAEADGAYRSFTMNNVVDKYVSVENKGKSDAFVRTVFAFEMGEYAAIDDFRNKVIGFSRNCEDGAEFDFDGAWVWAEPFVAEINGENYMIWEAVHQDAVAPKTTTIPSLLQVYMNKACDNAEVEKVDGNKNGTYDIIAISQAVQTAGFSSAQAALDEAFGKVADSAVAWFEGKPLPAVVNSGDAFVAATKAGQDVYFTDDVVIEQASESNAYGTTGVNIKNGETIDGKGNTLEVNGANTTWDSAISTTGGTIKNLTIQKGFRGIFVNHNSNYSAPVILENVIIDGPTYTISCDQGTNQNLFAYNSTFNGWTSYAATIGTVKFDGCSFGEGAGYAFCRPYAPTEFVNCDFEAGFEIDARAAVTLENCRLNGVLITADNIDTLVTGNTQNATVK